MELEGDVQPDSRDTGEPVVQVGDEVAVGDEVLVAGNARETIGH